MKIDLNPKIKKALRLIEKSQRHLFVTGRAGTGKSTLLTYWRGKTAKKIVVLAPTGVAALNVGGQTIHSFFRFRPDTTLESIKKIRTKGKNIYQKLDAIVIDEISMVRADLLDCIDRFLRLNGKTKKIPFGGVQMIFIGDLYQIPPVVTREESELFRSIYKSPYFFDAKVIENIKIDLVELEKVYRQKDQEFINLLNKVRNNSTSKADLALLNRRYQPDFEPASGEFYIYLTTTNRLAESINQEELKKLKTPVFTYQGSIIGDFKLSSLPTKVDLRVKKGAQVMMLNNDRDGRWVNGSVGRVVKIKSTGDDDEIIVRLTDGTKVVVLPFTWELFKFALDKKTNQLVSETMGAFTQYPFMLAWAVTIHKSQGKTFEKVIIDIGWGTFAHGQMYVALSRCTSLEGLFLRRPLQRGNIIVDWRVVSFLTQFRYQQAADLLPLEEKEAILKKTRQAGQNVEIVYLKNNDERTVHRIKPMIIGEMEYLGKTFLGVSGLDLRSRFGRTFRLDQILEINEIN
ncbi:ATP-dependent RecD-like DNA helicase [Patescibacteria group bacterium]